MTPPTHCPVSASVLMRSACVGCTGAPQQGQRVIERGQVLVMQGDPARHLFAIVSGWLREYTHDEDGMPLASRLIGPGQVTGFTALHPGKPDAPSQYTTTLQALTPTRVCILAADKTREWMLSKPEHALELAVTATEDTESLRRALALRTRPAEDRVLALIEEIVQRTSPADPTRFVRLPATREQLGEVLGLTLETVSRMIQRLARSGVIELKGREVRLTGATKSPKD